jgi:dTDP-4-amino-4,6-dideoxygalactose transaminase
VVLWLDIIGMTKMKQSINPYIVTELFEEAVADYAGSDYAVAVESCTAALFLSLMYVGVKGKEVSIPKRTYPGVPCSIIHAGGKVKFENWDWHGMYHLKPFPIIDGALRFSKKMYVTGTLHCLSFHIKKLLPIGRGGMILTDDFEAVKWLRKARFDGRNPVPLKDDDFTMLGWNAYMQPTDAARGLQLLQALGDRELEDLDVKAQGYPDLSKFKIYTQ